MPTQIGSFEAKTRFSELLRKVEQGESFTITLRGRVVAELTQPNRSVGAEDRQAAFARLRNPSISGVTTGTLLEWIREGRK